MHVTVKDEEKRLSMHQKNKIRQRLKACDDKTKLEETMKTLFKEVHYSEGIEPYSSYSFTYDNNTDMVTVCFLTKPPEKVETLRDSLKKKLQGSYSRKPEWVLYRKLRPHISVPLPTPPEIVENRQAYHSMLEHMKPEDHIAVYIRECLNA